MKMLKIISIFVFIGFIVNAQVEESAPPPAPVKKRVGNIDPSEKDRFRTRFEAKDSRYFAFGPGFGSNLNNSQTLYSFTHGYEWELGAQGALVSELFGVFGESTAFGDLSMGGKYFFSDEDMSPFVKGTFGMGMASIKDADSITGFSAKVGAGMTFFRTSTKHLEVSANYATIFKSTKNNGTPGVFVVSLALLY